MRVEELHHKPVPKKPNVKQMNDFRPVALTSILAKCMERIVCTQLVASVAHRMDPLQFASKASKGAEGAYLILVNLIASHRDLSGSYLVVIARTSEHRPLIHFRPTFLFKGFWI